MTSQYSIHKTTVYNVQYNIPRVNVGLPGRQNRAGDGRLRLTPGMAEAVEFVWGNIDGVPINLNGFTVKLIFWAPKTLGATEESPDLQTFGFGDGVIVVSKTLELQDPHAARGTVLITGEETFRLFAAQTGISWGLYMINADNEVFATQVSVSGARAGQVVFDRSSNVPSAESIRSA